jgi:ppGpp synthetase/RelA/SpoT-type nucleotidyltranferase
VRSAYQDAARLELLDRAAAMLKSRLVAALDGVRHIDRVEFRVKDLDRFCQKCFTSTGHSQLRADGEPRYTRPLEEVEDQVAGRILVLFIGDLAVVEKRVRETFSPAIEAVWKRPQTSSSFGYESNHYIFPIDEHMKPDGWTSAGTMPTTFELQVRTLFMHAYAEPEHELGYKAEAVLDSDVERQLAWIAASAWGADRVLGDLSAGF